MLYFKSYGREFSVFSELWPLMFTTIFLFYISPVGIHYNYEMNGLKLTSYKKLWSIYTLSISIFGIIC